MKRRTKIALLIGGGLLLATPPSLYLAAPSISRWYVLKNYPDVKAIGEIDIGKQGIFVSDIEVERPGIKASISFIFVNYDKEIWVRGGKVEVDAGKLEVPKKKSGDSKSSIGPIHASGLEVSARWKMLSAKLADVRVEPTEVCFASGAVNYPGFEIVTVEDGCMTRGEKKVATLKKASVNIGLPFDLPKLRNLQTVELQGVKTEIPPTDVHVDDVRLFNQRETKPHSIIHNIQVSIQKGNVNTWIKSVKTNHPWLSSDEYMTAHNLSIEFSRSILDNRDQDIALGQGDVKVTINPARWAFKAQQAACSSWMRAVPGAPSFINTQTISGQLGFEVRVKPTPKLKLHYSCKMDCRHPAIRALKKRFTYTAYDKDSKPFERTVDRNGPEWTPIRALPGHVPKAFVTFEDPYFEHHRGVMQSALFNSLKQNLQLGRFHRGGSTITMQLAKNLWLGRQKTVTRKAHEIMLASILEGCFSKSQILELYLNIVEFGPDVYGIGPAAHHWFGKFPADLEPDEAFWLARILPRPKKARPPGEGGLDRVRKLMEKLAKEDVIPEHFLTGEDPLEMADDEEDVSN